MNIYVHAGTSPNTGARSRVHCVFSFSPSTVQVLPSVPGTFELQVESCDARMVSDELELFSISLRKFIEREPEVLR